MDREGILRLARDRYEIPIWTLLRELELVLRDYSRIPYVNINDQRAVGSTLNAALMEAAAAAKIGDYGLEVIYCRNGRSNKVSGKLEVSGQVFTVSMELHLAGPKGGTSKSSHQFAVGADIDLVWMIPGLETTAPDELLFFIACHLDITGVSVARTYLKYADGVDQRMVQLQRPLEGRAAEEATPAPVEGPSGTKLIMKKSKGEQTENGITTDQRRDAASSS